MFSNLPTAIGKQKEAARGLGEAPPFLNDEWRKEPFTQGSSAYE